MKNRWYPILAQDSVADISIPVVLLPNLEEDIEEVLNVKRTCFPNLISLEIGDPPSCQMPEDEEELFKSTSLSE